MRIKLINIDENDSYSIVNPVILTPSKFAEYNENSTNFFMNMFVEKNL